jgi:uncharacterized membrane protein
VSGAGWEAVRWLHLVAMAFFVGGQLLLATAVVPVLRHGDDRTPLRAVARRFGYGTLAAIAVLAVTGAALASHYHRWGSTDLQVKLALVAIVALLIGVHVRRPALRAIDGAVFVMSLAIVWLGVAIAH